MIVNSLIKNPGGGLAPIGGYVAGKELIENCAYRLTSRIRGKEVGASRSDAIFLSRIFLWRRQLCGALKGAVFAANIYEKNRVFGCSKCKRDASHDIIQAVTFWQCRWSDCIFAREFKRLSH